MAMAKPKMSSPTRGNPYGKTGAPGKATEKKPPPSDDREPPMTREEIAQMGQMLGREMGQPQPFAPGGAEQTLRAAPPPRPQTPNLDALKAQQMPQQAGAFPLPPRGGAMPPGPPDPRFAPQQPPPMPDPRLQQLYGRYGI